MTSSTKSDDLCNVFVSLAWPMQPKHLSMEAGSVFQILVTACLNLHDISSSGPYGVCLKMDTHFTYEEAFFCGDPVF